MDICWQDDVSAFKSVVSICHSVSSKEQVSFNFMAAPSTWILEPEKTKSVTASTSPSSPWHKVCRVNVSASWQFLWSASCSQTGLSSLLFHEKRPCALAIKSTDSGEFPGALVWIWCFTAVSWVQSLVRELRFCKPHGVARKKESRLRCQTI